MKLFICILCMFFSIGVTSNLVFAQDASMSSFDSVSAKYPLDAKHFAHEASLEILKKYPPSTNFALVSSETRNVFIDNFANFLRKGGFVIGHKPYAAISYTLDYIDEERAYLRVQVSDGTHFGIVRQLGMAQDPIVVTTGNSFMSNSHDFQIINRRANSSATADAIKALQTSVYSRLNKVPLFEVQVWHMQKGSLMNQLESFTKEEGWSLIWNADYDLDMKSNSSFTGTFIEFIERLFSTLQDRPSGLRVSIYKTNHVLEVSGE